MQRARATPIATSRRSGNGVSDGVADRWSVLLLGATLTLVSAASMAVEIVAGRALAPYVGMSLYSWTMIIAVVLAGLSLGHWVGGIGADREGRARLWIAGALLGAAASTVASLTLLAWLEPLLGRVDPISHVGALTLAAFFAPSFCAGVVSPLLTKLALGVGAPERQGRRLGLFFALGAGGAILGTLLAGLLLVSWLGTRWSMIVIGALYALLATPFLAGVWKALGALGAAVALLIGLVGRAGACDVESAYYCIRIDDLGPNAAARVMALDHLAHGVNDRADPERLLSPYVHGVDELIRRRFAGERLDAFFIGGGAYTLPRAWLARYGRGRVTVAELDPDVTEAAHERLWLPRAERLETLHADARQALGELSPERRFDVVFGDAFHDISIPQHLVTDEFHREIKARLRPGGVYVVNVVDLLRAPRLTLSLAKTLKRRFASVELWIDLAEVGPREKRTTWIVLASDRPSAQAEMTARHGPPRRWVRVPTDRMIATFGDAALVALTDDFAPVDRLLAPVLLSADGAE